MKIIVTIILFIAFSIKSFAGTWNDKPVMCAEKQEVMDAIQEKKEQLMLNGNQLTKVRSKEGLQKRIVTLPLKIYANIEKQTFTIVEFHPEHKIYCVISYGTNFGVTRE
tara:strand:+ start:194 stop:520 length:327 start_codon:yes stop_codon:yes gene_type:complete